MGFKNWNIRDLSMSLLAIPLNDGGSSGFADDEVLSIEWKEDSYETYRGADGEVTRVELNADGAICTLRYAQTSGMNDRLMALYLADRALPNGAGAGLFKVSEKNGGRLVVLAERAWIAARPAVKRGKKVQVNEWKIEIADGFATFVGGK
jgi:hypothetical protein